MIIDNWNLLLHYLLFGERMVIKYPGLAGTGIWGNNLGNILCLAIKSSFIHRDFFFYSWWRTLWCIFEYNVVSEKCWLLQWNLQLQGMEHKITDFSLSLFRDHWVPTWSWRKCHVAMEEKNWNYTFQFAGVLVLSVLKLLVSELCCVHKNCCRYSKSLYSCGLLY